MFVICCYFNCRSDALCHTVHLIELLHLFYLFCSIAPVQCRVFQRLTVMNFDKIILFSSKFILRTERQVMTELPGR